MHETSFNSQNEKKCALSFCEGSCVVFFLFKVFIILRLWIVVILPLLSTIWVTQGNETGIYNRQCVAQLPHVPLVKKI
jgi:hypothetical protein